MSEEAPQDSERTRQLIEKLAGGDRSALDELLREQREPLRRMIHLRITPKMRARIDASDVIQEAFLEAAQRIPKYIEERPMPFFLWLRFLTRQRLTTLHRHHLGARQRDAGRERPLAGPACGVTSEMMAIELEGAVTSPSNAVHRAEKDSRLKTALDGLSEEECEILSLRHFEQLTNAEAAMELGIEPPAASKRYVRALLRLRGLLGNHDLSFTGFQKPAR